MSLAGILYDREFVGEVPPRAVALDSLAADNFWRVGTELLQGRSNCAAAYRAAERFVDNMIEDIIEEVQGGA